MTWEEIAGNWTHFKGRIKEKWGELTNDDLEVIDGEVEQLIGSLQARYGLTKEQAERELLKLFRPTPSQFQQWHDYASRQTSVRDVSPY